MSSAKTRSGGPSRTPASSHEGKHKMGLKATEFLQQEEKVMKYATAGPDADAAEFLEFLERCHDALKQRTGGNPLTG